MKKTLIFSKYIAFFFIMLMCSALLAVDVKTTYNRGIKSFNSGNYRSAELHFRNILNADNNDEYIDRARFYIALSIFNQKKYKVAIFEFNSFLNKSSSAVLQNESRFWIGDSYFRLNDYVKAIEAYNRFIKKSSNQELLLKCHERIGSIYYMQRRYDEAIIEWKKYISKSNNKKLNARILVKIGDAHFQNKNYDEALKILNRIITSRNDIKLLAKARLIIGRIYQLKGNYRRALITLNSIPSQLQKEMPFAEAGYFKAISSINLKKINEAKTQLKIFILIGKKSVWFYDAKLQLGKILLSGDDAAAGAAHLEAVRVYAKKNDLKVEAATLLSKYYLKKSPAKAIPYLKESLKNSQPNDKKEILLLLGKIYIKLKKFSKAREVLDRFYKEFPFDNIDEVSFLRGRIFLEMGNYQKAVEIFKKLKKENPFSKYIHEIAFYLALARVSKAGINNKEERNAAIRLLRGYLRKRNVENRYDAYLLLLDLYKKNNNIRRARAIVHILMKKYKSEIGMDTVLYEYIKFLKKKKINQAYYIRFLMKNYPNTKVVSTLYYTLADEFFKKKKYNKAEEYYQKYLDGNLTSRKNSAYYNRLLSLYHLKKYREVVKEIQKKNKPLMDVKQWKKMQLLLGRSYFSLGEYEKVYNFMDIYRINEYSKNDQLLYLKSSLAIGDVKTAIDISKYLEKHKKYFAEALFLIGNFYVKKNNAEAAKGFYSRIIVECDGIEYVHRARINLAKMYITSKNYPKAVTQLRAIDLKEFIIEKNALLVIAYIRMDKMEKALAVNKKYYYRFLRSEEGEPVLKELVEYYYKKGKLYQFNRYARALRRYKGNSSYINYLAGKLYFRKKKYRSAYYNFYKLLSSKSDYVVESYYYLGRIRLLYYRDKRNALKFYNKLLTHSCKNKEMIINARIDLALIYYSMKKNAESKKQLEEILKIAENDLVKIKVQNLYEHFDLK